MLNIHTIQRMISLIFTYCNENSIQICDEDNNKYDLTNYAGINSIHFIDGYFYIDPSTEFESNQLIVYLSVFKDTKTEIEILNILNGILYLSVSKNKEVFSILGKKN